MPFNLGPNFNGPNPAVLAQCLLSQTPLSFNGSLGNKNQVWSSRFCPLFCAVKMIRQKCFVTWIKIRVDFWHVSVEDGLRAQGIRSIVSFPHPNSPNSLGKGKQNWSKCHSFWLEPVYCTSAAGALVLALCRLDSFADCKPFNTPVAPRQAEIPFKGEKLTQTPYTWPLWPLCSLAFRVGPSTQICNGI